MYVYIRSEPALWTVGHYGQGGTWIPESDHDSEQSAADRVHWLHGGRPKSLQYALEEVRDFFAQPIPDGDATVPLAQRLAGIGGLFIAEQVRQALAEVTR